MDIVFATQNEHKVREINHVLKGTHFNIVTMGSLGFTEDIPETGSTLEENALIKARYLKNKLNGVIIAEDTGLEIKALEGAPGVKTARYAGDSKDPQKNMDLVLEKLNACEDRSAQFRAVIAYINGDEEVLFEGIVKGTICHTKRGSGGFGYDPIFQPEGYDQTFAEMSEEVKKEISHRARAIKKLTAHL